MAKDQEVVVTDVDIPLGRMIGLLLKFAVAQFVVALLFGALGGIVVAVVMGVLMLLGVGLTGLGVYLGA